MTPVQDSMFTMVSLTRHVAHMLSPYVDGELSDADIARVDAHLAACPRCRAEWERIRAGAALVDDVVSRVAAPADLRWEPAAAPQSARGLRLRPGIGTAIQRERVPPPPGTRVAAPPSRSFAHQHVRTAGAIAAALLAAVIVALIVTRSSSPTSISAAAVLDTSDEALKKIVKPGELLHRRWRLTRIVTKPGAPPANDDWRIDAWLGGPNLTRSVSRVTTRDGRLMTVTISGTDGSRARSYLGPDYPGELRGVVLEMPTEAELRQAVTTLQPPDRARLEPLIDSPLRPEGGSLLLWEHRANRALLTDGMREPSLGQRIVLSLQPAVMADGEAAHRVTQLTLGAPWIDWRADGTPTCQLARVSTNHYISKTSYLTLKYESDADLEDGSRRVSATELEAIQAVPPDTVADPFALSLPSGTPTIRVSARAYLQTLADVLRRAPKPPTS